MAIAASALASMIYLLVSAAIYFAGEMHGPSADNATTRKWDGASAVLQ
jgi:hypothetical protein